MEEAVRRRHRAFVYKKVTCLSEAAQCERQRFLRLDAAERREVEDSYDDANMLMARLVVEHGRGLDESCSLSYDF